MYIYIRMLFGHKKERFIELMYEARSDIVRIRRPYVSMSLANICKMVIGQNLFNFQNVNGNEPQYANVGAGFARPAMMFATTRQYPQTGRIAPTSTHHFNKKGRQTLPLQRNKRRPLQNAQTLMYTHVRTHKIAFTPPHPQPM
jgi:hypothetical protein